MASLLAQLEVHLRACPASLPPVVATDADGTVWSEDVGDELFLAWLPELREEHPGARVLRSYAAAHAPELASAPLERLGLELAGRGARPAVPHRELCDLEARALAGCPEERFRALLAEVSARFVRRVRPEVREALAALRARGLRVLVVSASVGQIVEAALVAGGVPFDGVLAAKLEVREGAVRDALDGPIPMYEGKVRALEAAGAWPPRVALGDSPLDGPFLAGAHCAVQVHPRPALREALRGHPRAVLYEG